MEGGERKAGSATFFVSKPEIFHSSGYAKNVNSLNPTSYEPRFVSSFFFFSFFLFFFPSLMLVLSITVIIFFTHFTRPFLFRRAYTVYRHTPISEH